jgi:hypothetical protein
MTTGKIKILSDLDFDLTCGREKQLVRLEARLSGIIP